MKKSISIFNFLFVFVFFLSFSSALLINSFDSNLDYSETAYAPPMDVYSSNPSAVIFSLSPESFSNVANSNSVSFTASVNEPGALIWGQGYYYNYTSNSWKSFDFNGANVKNSQGQTTNWIDSSASKSLTLPASVLSKGANPVIAYICKKYDNVWKCGCASQTDSCKKWSLQLMNVSGSLSVQSGGGGQSCSLNTQCGIGFSCVSGSCVQNNVSSQNLSCSKSKFATASSCNAQDNCTSIMNLCTSLTEENSCIQNFCTPIYSGSETLCYLGNPSEEICKSRENCSAIYNEDGSYRQCEGLYNSFTSCSGESYYLDCVNKESSLATCNKVNFGTFQLCDVQPNCKPLWVNNYCDKITDESSCLNSPVCSPSYLEGNCESFSEKACKAKAEAGCNTVYNVDGSYRECSGLYKEYSSCSGLYFSDCVDNSFISR